MKVASVKTEPSSVTSWSPILSFRDSLVFCGEYWEVSVAVKNGKDDTGTTNLVDVWLCARRTGNDRLHKARNLSHDIYPVELILESALDGSLHRLSVLAGACPCVLDGRRFWPVVLSVALGLE